jgi:hypothetical protein
MDDDFGAMAAQLLGRRPADTRTSPRNQGTDALEISLLVHLSSFQIDGIVMRDPVSPL